MRTFTAILTEEGDYRLSPCPGCGKERSILADSATEGMIDNGRIVQSIGDLDIIEFGSASGLTPMCGVCERQAIARASILTRDAIKEWH